MLLTRLAYPFAIIAGIGLMVAEMHIPDWAMVVLLCATIIGHVWLTGRAVRAIADQRADTAIDATLTAVSRAHHALRRQDEE